MTVICSRCGREGSLASVSWKCTCGGCVNLSIPLSQASFSVDPSLPGLWRYRELLPPIPDECMVSLGEGFSPLVPAHLGGFDLLVKCDHLFPSGSFKDRGTSVMISAAKSLDIREILEDSSGNAGASVSFYAARAGIRCTIVVPASASSTKKAQITASGATLIEVDGDRAKAARRAEEMASGIYYASHVYNPFFLEGTRTAAYELVEQLNGIAPDRIVLPVGNGTLLLGLYHGFTGLLRQGIVSRIPELFAVQWEGCAPLYKSCNHFLSFASSDSLSKSLADGILIQKPPRLAEMVQAIKDSKGHVITVTNREIEEAWRILGKAGFYVEPTASVAFAAIRAMPEEFHSRDKNVLFLTGHGLKTGILT